MGLTMCVTIENDDGDEVEVELPAKHEVCPRCEGHGTHLTPSIGEHAYSADEWAEEDEDFREQYCRRGGIYDVTCEECKGKRVVEVVDEDRLTPEQRTSYEAWLEHEDLRARWDAEDAATRRMECGGY